MSRTERAAGRFRPKTRPALPTASYRYEVLTLAKSDRVARPRCLHHSPSGRRCARSRRDSTFAVDALYGRVDGSLLEPRRLKCLLDLQKYAIQLHRT